MKWLFETTPYHTLKPHIWSCLYLYFYICICLFWTLHTDFSEMWATIPLAFLGGVFWQLQSKDIDKVEFAYK